MTVNTADLIPPTLLRTIDPGPIDLGLTAPVRVFDTETWPNFTMVGVWTVGAGFRFFTTELGLGESLDAFAELVTTVPALWVGFNNLTYDNHIVRALVDGERDPSALKKLSDCLIEHNGKPNYCRNIGGGVTLDLFAIHKGPLGQLGGLKWVAHKLDFPWTREAPFPFDLTLNVEQMVTVCQVYNLNDVGITLWLLYAMQEAVRIRLLLDDLFGLSVIDVLSKPDSKLAEAILQKRLFGDELPKHAWVPHQQRQWTICGSEITDGYEFVAPELIAAKAVMGKWLLEYREESVAKEDSVERKINNPRKRHEFHYAGLTLRLGLGGLHSLDDPMQYESDATWTILDFDISAFYPYLIDTNGWHPRHLPDTFNAVYHELIVRRELAAAASDELRATAYKIANNSVFGKTKSPYSWLCDPTMTAKVCIAGQMIILQALELCAGMAGVQLIMANTDGWTLRCRRDMIDTVRQRVIAFADIYGLKVKAVEYSRLIRRDGNNYLALAGKPKAKGAFGYDRRNLSKMATERVVVDAVRNFFLHDTPLIDTIQGCTDLRDFLNYFKASRGWHLTDQSGDLHVGTMARWYHARDCGFTLHKIKPGMNSPTKVARATGVVLVPDLPSDNAVPADLDHAAYLAAAEALVLSVTAPDTRRNSLLAMADLTPDQTMLFQANAAHGVADLGKCKALDLGRFCERYAEKQRGTSYDSMKSVLFSLWTSMPGQLTRGDLMWCARTINAEVDDYFCGGRETKLSDMVEYFAYEVPPFPKPRSISECLTSAIAWASKPGRIEVAKRKRTMYHRTLIDSTYLTGTTLSKYNKSHDLFGLACALSASCVKYGVALDLGFLETIMQEVKRFYDRPTL